MSVAELVANLETLGVTLWEESGQLRFRAPGGVMTDERKAALREQKGAVLEHLRNEAAAKTVAPDPAARYEPFPLTDVQGSYLLGRRDSFAYGGVACHAYGELAFDALDPARLAAAWRALVRRHDMLRAVIDEDGSQRVLPETPDYQIAVRDVRGAAPPQVDAAIASVRTALDHQIHPPGVWPLFELRITTSDTRAVLHLSIDFLIADYVSIHLLLEELQQLYVDPSTPLPPLEITYRDYLLAERRLRAGSRYRRDREYWWKRIDALPGAPELPLAPVPSSGPVRFRRWQTTLGRKEWAELQRRAGANDLTASAVLLAAYAEVIGRWSRKPSFTLDVTLLQRLPLHPQVGQLVGDFTSIELLAVEPDLASPFRERARALQARLWEDLDHRLCSGIEVIREIGRRRGAGAALMPVVYTSAIGLMRPRDGATPADEARAGTFVYGISQTPQVWIDCQVMDRRGELSVNWDVREGVFPEGVVDEMFGAFAHLVHRLAADDGVWASVEPVELPEPQRRRRQAVNSTAAPLPTALLHEGVVAQALRTPGRVALIAHDRTLTYGELLERAIGVCDVLRKVGARPGAIVPVALEKSADQIVATLGVLLAGGAYLPIDTEQPLLRRQRMLADAKASCVLTHSSLVGDGGPADGVVVAVDQVAPAPISRLPARSAGLGSLAYVIYTSGSSGVPKGVMITHLSAANTVVDMNGRFGIGPDDRVLGLASLGFDLSVYDIFGPLARGGCLVLPDPARRSDPSHWARLVAEHGVTLWNSVPAQAQMLADYLASEPADALPSLRLAWLSGDWIPVTLPNQLRERLPRLEIVSLGGATEAAIWSICYPIGEVPPHWRSIPYGRPLANQTFHVLDPALRACPDWTAGDLYIGGVGLAAGYHGDAAKTAERFIHHPASGERLYRTGDLGRYLPDGTIEFLGREDFQVKIRGHRIELGEIEAALLSHPAVAQAVAIVDRSRPTEPRLAAFAETARHAHGERRASEPARVVAAAESAVAGIPAGDCEQVVQYAQQLDETALLAMLHALQQQGLFSTPDAWHSLEEILQTARVAEKHHRLIRRWLKALEGRGLVESRGDTRRYRSRTSVDAARLAEAWREVDRLQPATNRRTELIDYFRLASQRLPELMRGEVDPIQLLFPEGRVEIHEAAYNDNLLSRYLNALVTAAVVEAVSGRQTDGPVRVLEAGAGVGGTSMELIPALADSHVEYLFTDVSQFFLNNAQQRYGAYPWVRYALFDINRDYRPQGLAPNSVDVIVCANVLHYAVDARRVLQRFRELLAPGGWLVFIEMVRDNYQVLTSMEFLFDATVMEFEDVRHGRDETFIGREQWEALVAEAGGELAMCLPRAGDLLAQVGFHVFATRFKADRAAVSGAELRTFLSDRLPEYMVPAHVQVVDTLPQSANGKIDRAALASWLPAAPGQAPQGPGAEPATDLERRLARLWAAALAVPRVGRHETFFAVGGDSLLAAQVVGRMREEIPEAKALFFEHLLRLLLEDPTVASLAARLEAPAQTAGEAVRPSASPLVRIAEGTGRPRVLTHDASGTLASYEALIPALARQGPVMGLAVGSLDDYLSWQPSILVGEIAVDYAARLKADGHERVHVVGYQMGGAVAAEVARRLLEAGVAVDELTLVAETPLACLVDDDLLVEYLFACGAGIDPVKLGFPPEAALAAALRGIVADAGRVPDRRLASLAGSPELEAVAWCFRRLASIPAVERAASIASAVARAGTPPPAVGQVTALLDLFRHSLRGLALHQPEPYSGDVTLLRPREASPILQVLGGDATELWSGLCLGDLSTIEVPGTAWTCIRGSEGAALAELVAASSHAASAA